MMTAETIAKTLGGRRVGTGWMTRCPAHDDREPSLSISDSDNGKVLVRCHAGCDQVQVIAELRLRGLWYERSIRTPLYSRPISPCTLSAESEPAVNRRRARTLWQESKPIVGTIAESYLAKRGVLHVSGKIDPSVIRFHPSCPYGRSRYPCLLALMSDVLTNEPRAILRTALTTAGEKIGRMALGPKSGTAIKLTPDSDVTLGLVVGEGLETVLSAMQLGFSPAWALGDAGNLRQFPVLSGIECLTIIVDNDASGTGQRVALECSRRWTSAGRDVFRIIPDRCGDDLNDIVKRAVA
jgi:putative DNA primase/helicase